MLELQQTQGHPLSTASEDGEITPSEWWASLSPAQQQFIASGSPVQPPPLADQAPVELWVGRVSNYVFGKPDSEWQLMKELCRCKQTPGEDLPTFSKRLRAIGSEGSQHERWYVEAFLDGLANQGTSVLTRMTKPTSLAKATQRAVEICGDYGEGLGISPLRSALRRAPASTTTPQDQLLCLAKTLQLDLARMAPDAAQDDRRPRPRKDIGQGTKTADMHMTACYNCGRVGHLQRDCQQPFESNSKRARRS